MSDLIDRQAAIYTVGLNTWAGSRISGLPTIDAEPVRHGHWDWDGDYICSNCGERGHRNKWNYCPNCGAKMDEVIEDANTN